MPAQDTLAFSAGASAPPIDAEGRSLTTASQVEVTDLSKRFGDHTAVDNVSFDVAAGEIFGLLGPSGCGKTTTLRLIAGLEIPDGGHIRVADRHVVDCDEKVFLSPEKRNMAMVFQSYATWPHMSVFENVAFPLKVRNLGRKDVRARVGEILDLVGLGEFASRPSSQLSGGQRQRVSLARALVYEPDVLLLDEPLSNLDTNLREQMRTEIYKLQQRIGISAIFVTHDREEAMALCNRVAIMRDGRVVQVSTPKGLYERPRTPFVRDFLGPSVMFPATVQAGRGEGPVGVVHQANGREPAEIPLPASSEVRTGDRVTLSWRPEDATVTPYQNGSITGRPSLVGVVVRSIYQGRHAELHLRVGQHPCKLWAPTSIAHEPGDEVEILVDPNSMTVWPNEDSASHASP